MRCRHPSEANTREPNGYSLHANLFSQLKNHEDDIAVIQERSVAKPILCCVSWNLLVGHLVVETFFNVRGRSSPIRRRNESLLSYLLIMAAVCSGEPENRPDETSRLGPCTSPGLALGRHLAPCVVIFDAYNQTSSSIDFRRVSIFDKRSFILMV